MRRYLLALPLSMAFASAAFAAGAPIVQHAAKSTHAVPKKHTAIARRPSAPADEYFGRQKLSILGVRNTVHDLKIRYDGTVQRSAMVISVGTSVEDAMHAWATRYPGDMWLAHNMFQLDEIYMRVPTPEGQLREKTLSTWIIHDYPNTYYSKYLTHIQDLAYARAHAPPTATPTAAAPTPAPTDILTPQPTATAEALPTPTVSPTEKI